MNSFINDHMGLVPYLNPKVHTRFPTAGQNRIQRRTCLDYIYGPAQLKSLLQAKYIPHHLLQSDHSHKYVTVKTNQRKSENIYPANQLGKGIVLQQISNTLIERGFQLPPCTSLSTQTMDQFAVEKYDNTFFPSLIESLVKTGCKINRTANSMMRKRISELDTEINRLWESQPDNGPDRQQCYEIRNELINKRELQIHRLEEAHVNKTFDNYHKQADRTTSYHLRKNAYKKVPTEIECLRDRNGKLTVDRTVIEEKVHEFYIQTTIYNKTK